MPEQPHYEPESERREPYLCYPVIAFWASDEEDAGKVLRAAEVALEAVEGVELFTGDLFEEVYRRDEKNEDVSVDLPIPPAPVHREERRRFYLDQAGAEWYWRQPGQMPYQHGPHRWRLVAWLAAWRATR